MAQPSLIHIPGSGMGSGWIVDKAMQLVTCNGIGTYMCVHVVVFHRTKVRVTNCRTDLVGSVVGANNLDEGNREWIKLDHLPRPAGHHTINRLCLC